MTAAAPRRSGGAAAGPVPVLVLQRGDIAKRALAALQQDVRVVLFTATEPTRDWVALTRRTSGTLVVTDEDPLSALTYAVTAGVRGPIVLAVHKRYKAESRDLVDAGASACVFLPLNRADVDRVVEQFEDSDRVAHMDGTLRLLLDPITRIVRYGDTSIQLSQREFALLHCLCSRQGRPVSANEILSYVWSDARATEGSRQILDVYIFHLRKKLARLGLKNAISTVRGFGYSLSA